MRLTFLELQKNTTQEKAEFDNLDGARLVWAPYKSRMPMDKCVTEGQAFMRRQLDSIADEVTQFFAKEI